jgi:photosystem II stability/assembly factor-like uncharacterized protein
MREWKEVQKLSWKVKNKTTSSSKASIADANILSIAINPFDSQNVLFGTKDDGIIRTIDGGETLESTKFISEKVYGLAFDPSDGRIIYASGVWQERGKIWKSTDGGENWTEIFTAASDGPLVISLVIDKKNPKIIYVSTSDSQVLKSLDGGASWKNIFQAHSPVLQIAIDSANSNLIYFNLQKNGIYRSREGGLKSENIAEGIAKVSGGRNEFNFIKTDPNNGNWVYAVGNAGILKSKDGGNKWEKIKILSDAQTFPATSIAIKYGNSNELVYSAAKTVYKSDDQGTSWTPFQLADSKSVKILEYSAADPQIIFLGTNK